MSTANRLPSLASASISRGTAPVLVPGLIALGAARLVDLVWSWRERARQRRLLARLDDHLLADLGISRGDVHRETEKPFWQA